MCLGACLCYTRYHVCMVVAYMWMCSVRLADQQSSVKSLSLSRTSLARSRLCCSPVSWWTCRARVRPALRMQTRARLAARGTRCADSEMPKSEQMWLGGGWAHSAGPLRKHSSQGNQTTSRSGRQLRLGQLAGSTRFYREVLTALQPPCRLKLPTQYSVMY